jgi:hypothetical protein
MQLSTNKNLALARIIDQRNDIVHLDMAFGVAPIVRAFSDNSERKSIDVERPWRGATIRYVGSELSVFDLTVLLSLLAIAQRKQPEFVQCSKIEGLLSSIPLKKGLKKAAGNNIAEEQFSVVFETSFSKIRDEMGTESESSDSNAAILTSLFILQAFVIAVLAGDQWASTHLILPSQGDKDTLKIALSFRLVNALFGEGNYGQISMDTYRKLPKRGCARILYVHFVSWFAAKYGMKEVKINTLVENAYGVRVKEISKQDLKDKRFKVRQNLKKIREASDGDFTFVENDRNVEVTRHKPSQLQPETVTAATGQNAASHVIIEDGVVCEYV